MCSPWASWLRTWWNPLPAYCGTVARPNTGTAITARRLPHRFVSQGRAWGLITAATEAEAIAADTTIQADDLVYVADAYGRVTSIRNGSVGTMYYCVGRAKYPATAVNQRIRISVTLQQVKL